MKIKNVILSALFIFLSGTAVAGKYNENLVEIFAEDMMAYGSMTAARFSKNKDELIGCGTRTFTFEDGTSYEWGFCQASLAEEENVMCSTEDANLIRQINSVTDNSYIVFQWNEEGQCTHVGHSTQSFYIPGKKQLTRG